MSLVQLEAMAELHGYDHERAAFTFRSHAEVPALHHKRGRSRSHERSGDNISRRRLQCEVDTVVGEEIQCRGKVAVDFDGGRRISREIRRRKLDETPRLAGTILGRP